MLCHILILWRKRQKIPLSRMLCEQGYEYLPIHTESDLVSNLRRQLE